MIKKIIKLFLILLFLGLSILNPKEILPSIKKIYQDVKNEPQNKSYISDEKTYLKIFYLMEKNWPYYEANYYAFKNNVGLEGGKVWYKDVWGWRWPFVFHFWRVFCKNGGQIMILFIIFSLFSLFNSYSIAKKFISSNLAFLAPLMLFPYFLNAIRSTSFLFISWWGFFFFLAGLRFFYYNRSSLSTIFFTFAIISKEHFIIPILTMFVLALILKKNKAVFLIPLIFFLGFFFFHIQQVSAIVALKKPLGISQRTSIFNKELLLSSLSFSTNSYLLVSLRPALIWIILSFIGLFHLLLEKKEKYPVLIGIASFFPIFASIPFIGQSVWQDYWGIMYVPLTAIFSLSILSLFKKTSPNKRKYH